MNNYDEIINPYVPPKTKNFAEIDPQLKAQTTTSKNNDIGTYLWLGALVGNVLVSSTLLFNSILISGMPTAKDLPTYFAILIIGYIFAFIIGGVPAALTAVFIQKTQPAKFIHLHAFSVGLITSFFFYALFDISSAIRLALVGGISATVVRHYIHRKGGLQ